MRSEREKEELLGTAEVEKAEIREEVRLLLEQERVKAKEEQESLRGQMLQQTAQSQEREVALKDLYLEISRLKAEKAATVAAAETERAKVVERRAEIAAAAATAAVKAAAAASAAAAAAAVEAERVAEETRVREIEEAAAQSIRMHEEAVRAKEEAVLAEQERVLIAAAAVREEEGRAAREAATRVSGLTKAEVDWLTDAGVPMSPHGTSRAPRLHIDSLTEITEKKVARNGHGNGNNLGNGNSSSGSHYTETDTAATFIEESLEGVVHPHLLSPSESKMSKMFHAGNSMSPREAAGFFKMASATNITKEGVNGSAEG